ncbi:homoserine kinase [Solicola gregarius]|uniref:Homoserine kinase n=1 Tax=Solicola gregarius TaxID=2908642 RepID=A0AA46TIJ6_9ACTN|nr:homoserine kinase [Solicola gregarius]UYM05992.1 homoserine kinase [Solicola gregarius]
MSPRFLSRPVTIASPATSANLGPGYDAMGLALAYGDEITAEAAGAGVRVDVEGVGADQLPTDETHLVAASMLAAFDAMGGRPPGLRVRCANRIPHARGMGSSSAAIVGGIVAARELVEGGARLLPDTEALSLAARIEGHPDNVAAALLGGLTIAWVDLDVVEAVHIPVEASVVVFVPPYEVSTDEARALLPGDVPHADAARNAGRAALLVTALGGRRELLLAATQDDLHQAYRSPAMAESFEFMSELRQNGVPAVISGAGPTVLTFSGDAADTDALMARSPTGWTARALEATNVGARRIHA